MTNKERLIIFDTTLRDGEQSPGAAMTREEKVRIARQLEKLGVDVIEAGFAAASPGDAEAIRAVAEAVQESTSALPERIVSFMDSVDEMETPRAKAMLQTILKAAYIWRDGKIEIEFR